MDLNFAVTSLAEFTSPELIVSPLQSGSPEAAIGELCDALTAAGRMSDRAEFYEAVLQRERRAGTAIPPDWALPHARLEGLPQLCFALGRMRQPMRWLGPGGETVRLIFLSAVPERDGLAYLTLISGLARLSKDAARLEQLLQASDRQAIFELLRQIQLPLARRAGMER